MLPGCRQFRRDPDLFHGYLRGRTKVQGQGTGCGNSIQTVRMPALRFTHFTPATRLKRRHFTPPVAGYLMVVYLNFHLRIQSLDFGLGYLEPIIWHRSQSYPWFSIFFPFERQVCSTFVPLAFSPTLRLPTCRQMGELPVGGRLQPGVSFGRQILGEDKKKNKQPDGGFKCFLLSPRTLGFHDPIWRIFFNWVGSTTS